jgi:teichuronic acid biosynthesis glycosyltransferase TuaC
MKILIVTQLYPNSVQPIKGNFVREQARALANRHADLQILVPTPILARNIRGSFSILRSIQTVLDEGIEVHRFYYLELPSLGKYITMASYLLGLFFWFRRLARFDIIHVHFLFPDAVAVRLVCALTGNKATLIVTAHGSDVNEYAKHAVIGPLIRWALPGFRRVICVSSNLKERLCCVTSVPQETVTVVPNGVNLRKFFPRSKIAMRQKLGLPANKKIVAYVGRLVSTKGVALLSRLTDTITQLGCVLIIVGSGPELKHVLSRAAVDSVKVYTAIKHESMPELLSAIDLLIMPSLSEGLPTIVIESLACGTPVVGFSINPLREIFGDNECENGILVKEGDYVALAKALAIAIRRYWNPMSVRNAALKFSGPKSARNLEREYAFASGSRSIE